jgi:hypothetical protein
MTGEMPCQVEVTYKRSRVTQREEDLGERSDAGAHADGAEDEVGEGAD